jgi:hypothetical protein
MEALTGRRFQSAAQRRPALRRLRSIPSRPYQSTAALGHAGIALLRRRSLIASPLRIESLSAVALPDSYEKGGGERWRWFFKPKPCAPCRRSGSGRQKEQCDESLQVRSALDQSQVQAQRVCALQASYFSGRARILLPRGTFAPIARARIVAKRRAGSVRRARSTRTTTLRCKE